MKVKSLWGFIDKTGNMIIPAQFDHVNAFSGGYCAVEKNDRWGFVDKAGNYLRSAP